MNYLKVLLYINLLAQQREHSNCSNEQARPQQPSQSPQRHQQPLALAEIATHIDDMNTASSIEELDGIYVDVECTISTISTLGCNPKQVKELEGSCATAFNQAFIRLSLEGMQVLWHEAGADDNIEDLTKTWTSFTEHYDDLLDTKIPAYGKLCCGSSRNTMTFALHTLSE